VRLSVALLGGFEARLSGGELISLPTRKARGLLAYLAVHAGRPQPRDKLSTLLWGETAQAQARGSLRQSLAALRKSLEAAPATLLITEKAIALDAEMVDVDVSTFERFAGDLAPEALENAARLYKGDLLEGFETIGAAFEDWLLMERERLRELALEALAKLLHHQSTVGRTEAAIRTALRLLSLDPLQEAVHRTLMRLYVRQGRRATALRQYQLCVKVLQRELAVEPEEETRRLYQDVLRERRLAQPKIEPVSETPSNVEKRGHTLGIELPLMGRASEIARLTLALENEREAGQAVIIVGEAGVGKTRLAAELATAAAQRGGKSAVGRCYLTHQILPFSPWVDVLRALASSESFDAIGPVWRSELARLLPELGDPQAPLDGPRDDYLRLFEAVAQAIRQIASRSRLVLILEDFHWADEMSMRLFGFLSRHTASKSALLVATCREEEIPDTPLLARLLEELRLHPPVIWMHLDPLSEDATREVVRFLARTGTDEATLARIEAQVWSLSEGNAFVAVELMRAYQDGERLNAGQTVLPESVREVIRGRLVRLSPAARELLAAAAAIGTEFPFILVQGAAGLDEETAAEALEELVRRRVLEDVGERFDFVHDRIRDVAYGGLGVRRAGLHRRVGDAIESIYAADLEPHRGELGFHYREGELWEKAARYLRRAGIDALRAAAIRDSTASFDQALQAIEHLSDDRSRSEQAFEARIYRATAYWALGDLHRVAADVDEAERLARGMGDGSRWARVVPLRTAALSMMGHHERAIEASEKSLFANEPVGDTPLRAVTEAMLAFATIGIGDYNGAIQILKRTAVLDGDPGMRRSAAHLGVPAVYWRVFLAMSLGEIGELDEAASRAEEALRIAETTTQPYVIGLASWTLGSIYSARGDLPRAISTLEYSVAWARDYELVVLQPPALCFLGHAYARAGRIDEAVPLLEDGLARGASCGTMWWQSRRWAQLAETHLLADRAADASAACERAISLAETYREQSNRAYALRVLAEAAARGASPDKSGARRCLEEALVLANRLGMRPLAARCESMS
jgi:DNA-binding SARP family transcriptional activator